MVWVGRGGGRVDWSIGRVVRVGYDFCCRFGDRYARQNINSHIFSTGDGGGDFKGLKKKVQVMVTRPDFGGGVVVQRQIIAKAHDRGGFILATDSYTTNHFSDPIVSN